MTKRLTSEELQAIRVRAEKASEGPWDVDVPIDYCTDCKNKYEIVQSALFLSPIVAELNDVDDAEFIAHAREDIPKLLAEIERLKSKYDHLKIYIENSEATCEICGDYFMPNVDSEETLYYCGNCREEN